MKGVDEVVGIVKKASADFSLLSVRKPYVFFANHRSGLRHAFSVSVIFPVNSDGLDPLEKVCLSIFVSLMVLLNELFMLLNEFLRHMAG